MTRSRDPKRRGAAVAAALALFAAGVAADIGAAAEGPEQPAAPKVATMPPVDDGPPDGVYRVTLVTGDRVALTVQGGQYDVEVVEWAPRPDGWPEPTYEATAGPDGVFVIPSDAEAAIASGQVERSLFDVAYLAAHGFTDAQRKRLPVIVQYRDPSGTTRARAASVQNLEAKAEALAGSDVTSVLESIDGAGISVPKATADDFWRSLHGTPADSSAAAVDSPDGLRPAIEKVWLDRPVNVTLDESVPLIGAPQAWEAGYDATGVTVAILDTGIDATHPDLQGKVVASRSFVPGSDGVKDGNGHGTHVASTVAGTADTYRGVAPGAELAIGKVLSDAGSGSESAIIAGMEWAASEVDADVVSMSLGGGPTDGTDAMSQAVNELTASTGALFVIAAGNSGPGEETVGTPGAATSALTVAATDKQDALAGFSSRGPRKGDDALKPDIAAPGVDIVAASANNDDSAICRERPTACLGNGYMRISGTSMATPHVAGAAAIVRQQHPDWSPERVKAALMSTSVDTAATAYQEGAGRLAVDRAVSHDVVATTANLDFAGVPNDTTDPITRDVEFANSGSEAVTLTLTPSLRSSTGDPVPDGTLTLPQTLTVPAGGTATATATLDIGELPLGSYTGAVTATNDASGVSLTTPVGLVVEIPTVTLTIRTLDRDGQPMGSVKPWDPAAGAGAPAGWPGGASSIAAMDVEGVSGYPKEDFSLLGSSVERVEVVPGTYSIKRDVNWWDSERQDIATAMLIDAQVDVHADTTVVLDARDAVPVSWDLPYPTAGAVKTMLSFEIGVWDGRLSTTSGSAKYDYITPTEQVTANTYRIGLHTEQNMNPQATMTQVGSRRPTDVPLTLRKYPAWGDGGLTIVTGNFSGGWHPFPTGTHRLQLADAGFGRPEDLEGVDLRGKLALLRWGETRVADIICCPPGRYPVEFALAFTDRIDNVQQAGAAGFVLYGDPEVFDPWDRFAAHLDAPVDTIQHWQEGGPKQIQIPQLEVRRVVAHRLLDDLERGPVTVEVRSDPQVRYNITGSVYHDQQLPDDLHIVLGKDDLAKTVARFHSSTGPAEARLRNTSRQPGSWFRATQSIDAPHFATPRDEYVNYYGPVADDVLWSRYLFGEGLDSKQAELRTFTEPIRLDEDWNTGLYTPGQVVQRTFDAAAHPPPVGAPRPLSDFCTMCRQGNRVVASRSLISGDGENNGGSLITSLRMFESDGTEIPLGRIGGLLPVFELPPEASQYTATLEEGGISTEWAFGSAEPARHTVPDDNCAGRLLGWTDPCAALPMLYLSYDLGNRQRLDNTLIARSSLPIGVRVSPGASTEPTPAIAGLKVWTSVDGGNTWKSIRVVPRSGYDGGERWYDLRDVHGSAGQQLSIKAEAWDVDGNRIQQVITDRLTFS